MKKALFVIVALFVAMAALASEDWRGSQRLSGVITDKTTGAPVAGAKLKLRIEKGSHGGPDVVTDKNGRWAVLGLAAAAWDIDIEAPGYVVKQVGPVTLMINQTMPTMKIEIEPQAASQTTSTAEPAHEEVKIGGTAVSKEIADAVEAGNNFLQAQKFKEAVTEFEKAYPTLSSNVSLKFALARAYYGAGDLKKAIVLLDEVYKSDPANAQNAMLLANMLLEDGQLDSGKKIIDTLPASRARHQLAAQYRHPADEQEAAGRRRRVLHEGRCRRRQALRAVLLPRPGPDPGRQAEAGQARPREGHRDGAGQRRGQGSEGVPEVDQVGPGHRAGRR